jgi:hypothetical protein
MAGRGAHPGVIVAGTNIVATDSIAARVMGFDPDGDYPEHPFFYRRNVIRLAARAGLGPNRRTDRGARPGAGGGCHALHGSPLRRRHRRGEQLRRGAECVARYRERQAEWAERFGEGRFLALFDGDVLWDGPNMQAMQRLERESGRDWQSAPQLVIRCLPPEAEVERLDWYGHEAEASSRIPEAAAAVRKGRRFAAYPKSARRHRRRSRGKVRRSIGTGNVHTSPKGSTKMARITDRIAAVLGPRRCGSRLAGVLAAVAKMGYEGRGVRRLLRPRRPGHPEDARRQTICRSPARTSE